MLPTEFLVKPPCWNVCIVLQVAVCWQRHCYIDGAIHWDWSPIAVEKVNADRSDRGEVIPSAVSYQENEWILWLQTFLKFKRHSGGSTPQHWTDISQGKVVLICPTLQNSPRCIYFGKFQNISKLKIAKSRKIQCEFSCIYFCTFIHFKLIHIGITDIIRV